ncbi:methyl-accepting chemotaxis protein [Paragemmobacter straminiformis]|uniref:Methyl-accepting chemotaxis protein n=1 Tax=Paragemmobacter straminiformis TaxID=2045119 RepID=A0A842IBF5_9RHOB|nr:methyl-accepting chemotaxis protein [Gemmobacter straminiformis]MBC2836743.1 hypothetical protein [Gemmobacter straminiformis]
MVLLIAGAMEATVYVGLDAADRSADKMRALATERLPVLARSNTLLSDLADVNQGFAVLLAADDAATMQRAEEETRQHLAEIAERIGSSGDTAVVALVAEIDHRLKDLVAARHRGFVRKQDIDRVLRSMQDATTTIAEFTYRQTEGAQLALVGDAGRFIKDPATGEAGKTVIEGILRKSIDPIRRLTALDAQARTVFAAAIGVALSDDVNAIRMTKNAISAHAALLDLRAKQAEAELAAPVAQLVATADPATGIVAMQIALLQAQSAAEKSAAAAVQSVSELASHLSSSTETVLSRVESATAAMLELAESSQARLVSWSVAAALFLAACPLLAWVVLIAPIRRATRATALLSQGVLTAVDGLKAGRGELGQLTAALTVFRDTLRDKQRLETEERASREALAERRRAEERETLARARQTAEEKERQGRETAARLAAETAERDRQRSLAEAEQQERLAVQTRIVSALGEGLRRLSAGDLTTRIAEPFPGAYDRLRLDFNAATTVLGGLMADILVTAESIRAEAGTITGAADSLSRRTESNAATLEQTAAALSEITGLVRSTARQTAEANEIAADADAKARQGRGAAGRAQETMGAIARASAEITRILELIQGIAFQTNLLALNAGVEAARAGDSGRGFAVVASEVRALAQRTTDAAAEISALITGSATEVERGVTTVAEVDAALTEIGEAIATLNRTIAEVVQATQSQSTGLTEIDSAMSLLDQSTQSTAATAVDVTHSSEGLIGQLGRLREKLDTLTIGEVPPALPLADTRHRAA